MGVSTMSVVKKLKEEDQDFEFYPTTNKMLSVIFHDMGKHYKKPCDDKFYGKDVLDIGCGDGRVLEKLAGKHHKQYGIEKSKTLVGELSPDVFLLGTDFHQSTLIDKKVPVVFCNPPYSEYELWASKIISEANAEIVYLIIPGRWKNSSHIKLALESRNAEAKIIDSDDFLGADRAARAKVDILCIELADFRNYNGSVSKSDPFDIWFKNTFETEAEKAKPYKEPETFTQKVSNQMVDGKGLIQALVALYNKELSDLNQSYKTVLELDNPILQEFLPSLQAMKDSLKMKIETCKEKYWKEFFKNYESINSKLTKKSLDKMVETLTENTSVDFTESNAYAVTIWAIKNANKYHDQQLIDLVERMVDKANIKNYKSNNATFGEDGWRYNRWNFCKEAHHYKLEYRVVLAGVGGTANKWSYDEINGLKKSAHEFLNELLVVTNNLGFGVSLKKECTGVAKDSFNYCKDGKQHKKGEDYMYSTHYSESLEWGSGVQHIFYLEDGDELMRVRAYNNGNLHIKFSQKFMRALNVEFGRLKGWLKDKTQASEELNIPVDEVAQYFGSNKQIMPSDAVFLLENKAA